ncbi:unnamed protein product [Moneuplotes crassus]|uniref:Uncharacterized protein n=1 Tax=Euplotes crassus TaxID=5936 RepID=A0AAD2D6Z6_EUPCR|nr:unnamed protein product [Moneuplotes crassus]
MNLRDTVHEYFSAQDMTKYNPEYYKFIQNNKEEYLIKKENETVFEKEVVANCIKPCFKYLETAQTVDSEFDCMQNCYAKSMEVNARFKLKFNRHSFGVE